MSTWFVLEWTGFLADELGCEDEDEVPPLPMLPELAKNRRGWTDRSLEIFRVDGMELQWERLTRNSATQERKKRTT